MDFTETGWFGLDSFGSEQGQVKGFSELAKEPSGP